MKPLSLFSRSSPTVRSHSLGVLLLLVMVCNGAAAGEF